jgi:transposase
MILDNAKIHKTPEVKASISANGLKILYIPPFSAQLNPVEKLINTFS